MDLEEARREAESLKLEIAKHDVLYYVKDSPEIEDDAYDALMRRLVELEKAFPSLVSENSPTRRVGGTPRKEMARVSHSVPMLSLENAFSEQDVLAFLERVSRGLDGRFPEETVCELKIDGLAVSLLYLDGEFVRGATRGDGRVGEDVTENLRTIRTLPTTLQGNVEGVLEVRGEVLMKKVDFENLNREREENEEPLFANPAMQPPEALGSWTLPSRVQGGWGFSYTRCLAQKPADSRHSRKSLTGFPRPGSLYREPKESAKGSKR
jgi:NAD-dependent DNA ligase (contains BRCT domain type II)